MSDIIVSSLDIRTQERVEIRIQIPTIIIEDVNSSGPPITIEPFISSEPQPMQAPLTASDPQPMKAPLTASEPQPMQAPLTASDPQPMQAPLTASDPQSIADCFPIINWEVTKVEDVPVFKKREDFPTTHTEVRSGQDAQGHELRDQLRPSEYICYFMYVPRDSMRDEALAFVTSVLAQSSNRWHLIIVHDESPLEISANPQIEMLHAEKIGLCKAYQLAMLHCNQSLCCPVLPGVQLLPDTTQAILNAYRRGPENAFVYWSPFTSFHNVHSPLKNGAFKNGQGLCTFRHISYYLTDGFQYDEHYQAVADLAYKLEKYCYPHMIEGPLSNILATDVTCKTLQEITQLRHITERHGVAPCALQWHGSETAFIKMGPKNDMYYLGRVPGKIMGNTVRWNHTGGFYESVGGLATFRLETLLDGLGAGRHLNHYFDMVYVINLQKDTKKRRRMTRIFERYNIGFRFFPATYGLQQPYYGQFLRLHAAKLWNPGAYGYSLSVINILKDAIKNNYQRILVCDDDLVLCKDFNRRFHDVIERIPADWQLLYFGLSGPLTPYVNDGLRNYRFSTPYITDTSKCDGSFCLGYHQSVFNQVLKMALEFSGPFDTALNRYYLTEHPEIRKYVFYPYLVTADMTSSDITQRDKNIMDNYSAYQYRYRVNVGCFDFDTRDQEPRQLKETFDLLHIEHEPPVTVIFYNYNEEALRSITSQSYNNLEIIVIRDNTAEHVRDIRDSRVQIINNERPIGIFKAFRKALALSNGAYITLHREDYRSAPERIGKVLQTMQTCGLNACATHSGRDRTHFYLTGVIAKRGYTGVIENILRGTKGIMPVTVINSILYYPAPESVLPAPANPLPNMPYRMSRKQRKMERRR